MSYYDFFDDQTNNGRVFDTDLSELDELPVKHLTAAEVTERKHWWEAMQRIYDHYDEMDSPRVSTTELLLQQRVMVPNLGSMSVSSRSQFKEARRGRRYPPTISAWDGFKQRVEAFQPQHKELRPKYSDIFQLSMFDTSPKMMLCEEKEEEGYMLSVLRKSLMTAGLMGAISCRGGIGKPDAITLKEDDVDIAAPADIGLVVEFKSTHNLPVPMTDVSVVETYNTTYHDVISLRSGRTPAWSRVCHPIGQLLGYMVENGRRYGVLSSATRAYFLFIEGEGENAQVRISSPWFIGEPNFLRAWAFVHHASCQPCVPLLATQLTWKKTSGDHPTPPAKRKRTGLRSDTNTITEDDGYESVDGDVRSTSRGGDAPAGHAAQMSALPEIPIENVEIVGTLGYGHNGVVFLANWRGQKVALKQFDVGKDGYEYFDSEVAAYLALESVWGSLVVTPLFVSESWSGWIKFIGLQLGRDPLPGDDVSERINVLSTLENKYGFRHDDIEDGNMIFIFDEKTKTERLVAIDLEAHTMIA